MFFVRHAAESKLSSVIQPLVLADFIVKLAAEGLGFIDDYREVIVFKRINGDIFKLAYASYMVALADAALPDSQPDAALFAFLLKSLELMEEGLDEEVLTNIFEVQLLSRFGVSIDFSRCAVCHRTGLPLDFSYRFSGCLCPQHADQDSHRARLDPNLIYLLSRFQEITFDDLRKISIQPAMKAKLRLFLDQIYDEYVGIQLKAKKFIDQMGEWGQLMKGDI